MPTENKRADLDPKLMERAREWATIQGIIEDGYLLLEESKKKYGGIFGVIVAFAQAIRDEERERCCKAMCSNCTHSEKWEPAGVMVDGIYKGDWRHRLKTARDYSDYCDAAAIREGKDS